MTDKYAELRRIARDYRMQTKFIVDSADVVALLAERDALLGALEDLRDAAGRCDGWSSFPSKYLDPAESAIKAANGRES